ncbi:cell division protein FtsQ/DivIB [Desulfovulcanus sp.]
MSIAMVRKTSISRGNRYLHNSGRAGDGLGALIKAILILGLKTLLGLGFIAGISLGLIYGYRLVTGSEYFALKQVEINGNKRLTYGEITSSLGLNLGQNILDINIAELQLKLSKNPWVKEVFVRRELPDKIRIAIVERQACFWVKYGHKLFYADQMGKRIAEVLPNRFISLPLLYVDAGCRYCAQHKQLLPTIVSLLDKKMFPFSWQDLGGIHLSRLNRIEFFLENPRLKLSLDMDGILENVHKLNLVWKDLRHRGELNNVDEIRVLKGHVWVGFEG